MVELKVRPDSEGDKVSSQEIRIPAEIYPYSAGIKGGLAGGLAMIPIALLYGLLSGLGIWYPVNLIAATILRTWQNSSVTQLSQFHVEGLLIGLAIHILMSVILGLVFAIMLPALPKSPIFWAYIVGPFLWAGAIFAGLPLVNPVMAQHIDLISFAIANIIYSLVLGIWVSRTPKIPANRSA